MTIGEIGRQGGGMLLNSTRSNILRARRRCGLRYPIQPDEAQCNPAHPYGEIDAPGFPTIIGRPLDC
jgi:hypothetical protein